MNYQYFDPNIYNNYQPNEPVANNEERLIPFVGGALIGGLTGAAIAGNRTGFVGGGGYPTYYYPTYYYPYYPVNSGMYYGYGINPGTTITTAPATTTTTTQPTVNRPLV